MTTPSTSDGSPRHEGEPGGDLPFLPPARPTVPAPAVPAATPAPAPARTASDEQGPPVEAATETPFLPRARPPEPARPTAAATFDAKAMVESQKHYNANPAYGEMPSGTEESRAAARKLREDANRKRRRSRTVGRLVGLLVLVALGVGGYFVYLALQDDADPADSQTDDVDADDGAATTGGGEALSPLGEQELVIEGLDDLNSGARPSAGGFLDAVDQAREVVGQAEPPVGDPSALMVADVFSPAVLDHTDVLDPVDGYERFVVRAGELAAVDPSAQTALVERLLALPQVADGDPQLAVTPVVLPGDIAIAIQRDEDRITRLVAVASDPVIRTVGP